MRIQGRLDNRKKIVIGNWNEGSTEGLFKISILRTYWIMYCNEKGAACLSRAGPVARYTTERTCRETFLLLEFHVSASTGYAGGAGSIGREGWHPRSYQPSPRPVPRLPRPVTFPFLPPPACRLKSIVVFGSRCTYPSTVNFAHTSNVLFLSGAECA